MAYTMDSSIDQQEVAAFVNRVVADTSGLAVTVMAASAQREGKFFVG
jgi:CO dehydrogenase/acetyl-CoA synthase gamma subunit (corrinoid Fe-S protein)